MDWIKYTKIIPAIITIVLIYLVIKYLKDAIKDDRNGKKSDKCDLD